jgi:hypothetical protein
MAAGAGSPQPPIRIPTAMKVVETAIIFFTSFLRFLGSIIR